MGHIDVSVQKKCYADTWSYCEICVGCNCCGRIERGLLMWIARLDFHKSELERNNNNINNNRFEKLQNKIRKQNINYHNRHIKKCKERIKHFEGK